ncbi:MAG: hypothetical protein JSS24_00495 [Proteobacteria bacterium]|nr:hypothetical protein [Pseudomonadota bacterium]
MTTELSLKLKALTLALMINVLILGGTAVLFDGHMHGASTSLMAHTHNDGAAHAARATLAVFRP